MIETKIKRKKLGGQSVGWVIQIDVEVTENNCNSRRRRKGMRQMPKSSENGEDRPGGW